MQATMALLINTAREIAADKPCMTQHTQRSGRFEGLWHRRFTKTKRKEDVLKASASSFGLLCRCCLSGLLRLSLVSRFLGHRPTLVSSGMGTVCRLVSYGGGVLVGCLWRKGRVPRGRLI